MYTGQHDGCEAGNVHSSGAPDFTLQWSVIVLPSFLTDFDNVLINILLEIDFGFGSYDMGWFYCWQYYWDEPSLLYLDR